MFKYSLYTVALALLLTSCHVPKIIEPGRHAALPATFGTTSDTSGAAAVQWRSFFNDKNLADLIDTALKNNQELMITLQEIEIARNDVRVRKAAIAPSVSAGGGIGVEKVGRYTSQGAGDASTEIKPGKEMPDPLGDFRITATANWEADIWRKLRNARDAAVARYLATVEGKNLY